MAILSVPITKSKGFIEVETSNIPEAVYAEALLQGLKVLMNRGTSKITKETYPDEAQLKAAAQAKAQEQFAELHKTDDAGNYTGSVKLTGSKAIPKASGAVMTEARRLAKNIVKDEMKRAGIKISHVEAKVITEAANELLKEDPTIIETAKASLEARQATPVRLDIKALIKESPALIAKAEAKKAAAKKDAPLSAKQAGKPKPRTKPGTNVGAAS